MRLVISHSDLTTLALAFGKCTYGYPNGTRAPHHGGHKSFFENAEQVLRRVVAHRFTSIEIEEFRVLRHCLGSSNQDRLSPDLGWRNYYYAPDPDPVIESLVSKGLMRPTRPGYYEATERGWAAAGAPVDSTEGGTE